VAFGTIRNFGRDNRFARDITALHVAASYWNTEATRALFETQDLTELASACDSEGRLPLHWAVAGHTRCARGLAEKDSARTIYTIKALLSYNPAAINIQDSNGCTSLYYAVQTHAGCGASGHTKGIVRFLLEHGADPSLSDRSGLNVLHKFAYGSLQGEPIDTALLELLVTCGADLHHVDN
jgi:ankyrin repeat protein